MMMDSADLLQVGMPKEPTIEEMNSHHGKNLLYDGRDE